MQQNCGNCKFFMGDEMAGECRRHAPVFHRANIYPVVEPCESDFEKENPEFTTSGWPGTDRTEWCGEWKMKMESVE